MSKSVKIVEVGLRDGLQNESIVLDLSTRLNLLERLAAAGLTELEVGAFVSPVWVPQMANSQVLITKAIKMQTQGLLPKGLHLSALVPNLRGYQDALSSGVKEIAVFASVSEGFSQKNINCSVQESLARFKPVFSAAKSDGLKVRAYLSTVFGCPYDGKIDPQKVVDLTKQLLAMGAYEISLGDTIGAATPLQVTGLMQLLRAHNIDIQNSIALHLHDTRGLALVNIRAGLDEGVRIFDSSICGLGGCPYAVGASGNVATEEVVFLLESLGFATGISVAKLIEIQPWLTDRVQHPLPSKLAKAGLFVPVR